MDSLTSLAVLIVVLAPFSEKRSIIVENCLGSPIHKSAITARTDHPKQF